MEGWIFIYIFPLSNSHLIYYIVYWLYFNISGLLQPELYTTFLASIIFSHSVAKAQHREQGKHLSTIIGGIYLLSLQLDSIYTTQRDNTVR